jgi:hypothetical protein
MAQRFKPKKETYSNDDAMGAQACWASWARQRLAGSGKLAQDELGWLGWILGGDSNGIDF